MVEVTKDVIYDWKKWYLSMGHTYPSTETYFSFIKRYVGDGVDITQKTVDKFREGNMNAPCSGALKSLFKYLVSKRGYPMELLSIRFDRNKSTKRYPNSINWQEVQILVNSMPSLKTKIFTIFSFELGLRLSEGLKIKWSDFNWREWLENRNDYGKVILRNTKRGKFRVMPVKKELMELIYSVCSNKTDEGIPITGIVFNMGVGIESYILKKENSNEKNLFDYLNYAKNYYREIMYKISKEKLGKRIHPHVLRHSKAQMLMDNGMPIESLKNFLGHEEISTTELYAQASPEKVKRDLKAFDIFKDTQLQIQQSKSTGDEKPCLENSVEFNSRVVQSGSERHPHEVEAVGSNPTPAIEES